MTAFLVATGPGDPALLTVQVERLLATAAIVAPEPEVPPAIVALAGPGAKVVDVERDDTAALVALAAAGAGADADAPLVRLSSGDRLALQGGGREAAALRRAGIDHQVVPVVLATLALPTTAGIPVMSRDLAPVLRVVVGRDGAEDAEPGTTVVALPDPSAPTVDIAGAVATLDLRGPTGRTTR